MKKTRSKKFVGGLMAVMLLATIGAVLVSAEFENEDATQNQEMLWKNQQQCGEPPFLSDLTVEQREELETIMTSLKEEGASKEEIREAIFDKLDEYGVLDKNLDDKIEHTEQKLEILNRKKELRRLLNRV